MNILPQRGIRLEDAQLYDKITKIETTIIDKLGELRKRKLFHECEHIIRLPEHCQPYCAAVDYYSKFWKMFLAVEVCKRKKESYEQQLLEMGSQLQKIQILFQKREQLRTQNLKVKPKIRRKAQQINRSHTCPFQLCDKSYGSQLALKLHIKMKHNQQKQSSIYHQEL